MSASRINRQILLKEKGTICSNCEKDVQDAIIFHHIVPEAVGGQDILTNICALCNECHSLIHYGKKGVINHSELIKAGMAKAKAEGKQIGGRKPIPIEKLEAVEKLREQGYTVAKALEIVGLSRGGYYDNRYKLKEKEKYSQ